MAELSVSGLFRRNRGDDAVRPGQKFIHRGPGRLVETATVMSVSHEVAGIPHVRYKVVIRQPFRDAEHVGGRIMSMDAFKTYFPEPAP